jgi:hypothetical protein
LRGRADPLTLASLGAERGELDSPLEDPPLEDPPLDDPPPSPPEDEPDEPRRDAWAPAVPGAASAMATTETTASLVQIVMAIPRNEPLQCNFTASSCRAKPSIRVPAAPEVSSWLALVT